MGWRTSFTQRGPARDMHGLPMTPTPQQRRSFITGLDLGQARDYSALAVLDRSPARIVESRTEYDYAVRHLERLPLGTSYTTVCDYLVRMFAKPGLPGTMLAVDETGVGRPV